MQHRYIAWATCWSPSIFLHSIQPQNHASSCLHLFEIAPLVQDCSRHLLCGWDKDWNFVIISKHLLSWKCKGTTHYSQANQKILLPLPWFLWVLWVFRFQTQCQGKALVGEAKMLQGFRQLEVKPKQKESPRNHPAKPMPSQCQANGLLGFCSFPVVFQWFCNGSRTIVEG